MSQVVIAGDTSGTITLQAPAVSGSSVLTLPATTATLATLTTPSFGTTIGVGAATASASGAGITFPATQSASSDANTLDDYEEGTWSPNQGSGITRVGTFSSSGTYTKIGNLVFIAGKISATTSISCSAGGILSSNLPFTCRTQLSAAGGVLNGSQASSGITFVNPSSTELYTPNAIASFTDIYYSAVYQTT